MISNMERERRWKAVRTAMKLNGCDMLVVAGREGAIGRGFIRYLSDWYLWGGTGFMLFQKEEDPSLFLGSESQSMWAREISWVNNVVFNSPSIEGLTNQIKKANIPEKIFIAGLGLYMINADVNKLKEVFPDSQLIDATEMLERIIMIKSEEEIRLLKETADAVEAAMCKFKEELKPGKTEREVVSKAWQVARERGILDGIAHISNTFPPFIHPATDRVITEDDIIKFSMEMAGPSGYWIELSAVFSFKQPPAHQLAVFNTTARAVGEIAKLLKPGTVGGEIAEAVERVFQEDGWDDVSRIIWDSHGIGLDVIEYPIIRNLNETVLEQNMVISVHPGLTVGSERLGFYIQDNFIVMPGGAKSHSNWEHKWHIID